MQLLATLALALCCIPGLCQQQFYLGSVHQQELHSQRSGNLNSRNDIRNLNTPSFTNAHLQPFPVQLTNIYGNPYAYRNLRFHNIPHNMNNNFPTSQNHGLLINNRVAQSRSQQNIRNIPGHSLQSNRAVKSLDIQNNRAVQGPNLHSNGGVQGTNQQSNRGVQGTNQQSNRGVQGTNQQTNWYVQDRNLQNNRPSNSYSNYRNIQTENVSNLHAGSVAHNNVKRNIPHSNTKQVNNHENIDNIRAKNEKTESQIKYRDSLQVQRTNSGSNMQPNIKLNSDSNIQSNTRPNSEPIIHPNPRPNSGANIQQNIRPNSGANIHPNIRPNSGSNIQLNIRPNAGLTLKTTVEQLPSRNADFISDSHTNRNAGSLANSGVRSDVRSSASEPKVTHNTNSAATVSSLSVGLDNVQAISRTLDVPSLGSNRETNFAKRQGVASLQRSNGPINSVDQQANLPNQPRVNSPTAGKQEPNIEGNLPNQPRANSPTAGRQEPNIGGNLPNQPRTNSTTAGRQEPNSQSNLPNQPRISSPINLSDRQDQSRSTTLPFQGPNQDALVADHQRSNRKLSLGQYQRSNKEPNMESELRSANQGNPGQITHPTTYLQPPLDESRSGRSSRVIDTSLTLFNNLRAEDKEDGILWTYQGPNGFSQWGKTFNECGGASQSPINISPHFALPADFGALVFVNYHLVPDESTITNNGHSVQVDMKSHKSPWIVGGGLPGQYILVQYHLHWGYNDLRGSEHTINHVRYPMELHMVHYKATYGSIEAALRHPDGVAVLAVLFEVSRTDNPALTPLVRLLPNITRPESYVLSESMYPVVTVLPRNLDLFYRYSGSLTTPTCNEAVIWTVFDQAIPISEYQLAAFRTVLTDRTGVRLRDNFRPTQPLNNRQIYRSATSLGSQGRSNLNNNNNDDNSSNNNNSNNDTSNNNNNLGPNNANRLDRSISNSNSSLVTVQSIPGSVTSGHRPRDGSG